MVKVFDWNARNLPDDVRKMLPAELQNLPPGRYVVESVEAPKLTPAEEDDLIAALAEDDHEPGSSLEDVHKEMQQVIARARNQGTTR
jgi:hypothetical protein